MVAYLAVGSDYLMADLSVALKADLSVKTMAASMVVKLVVY